ncbi:porin family protein [Vibrio marisflavi]|uniref:Outer membrane protein beta-barrel domain-containing protein n=1 Tax=Vibrio marisflavi CECT 7928 TaxID=634439 RepID=A0ABM9A3P7_9VIBR|nr:porin family protein [Vibrio marisflavi]CAH0539277.1 hypothetical protein VMF7928_02035 [Vibrio marisflavi CECT 7928]
MKQKVRLILLSTIFTSFAANADFYVTPWVGYTGGGEVKDQDGTEYRIRGSESGAVSLESDFDDGRIGLFYAYQKSKVKQLSVDTTMNYLLFQSSLHYEIAKDTYGYLGAGIGGSYVDTDWMTDYGFSASIFTGFEYRMFSHLYLNGQMRWLGTSVDGETTGACTSSSSSCVVQFKTDWINQYSANFGITIVF